MDRADVLESLPSPGLEPTGGRRQAAADFADPGA
jgi:hypothetical protein